jgi:hypothetical protein
VGRIVSFYGNQVERGKYIVFVSLSVTDVRRCESEEVEIDKLAGGPTSDQRCGASSSTADRAL